MRTIKRVPDLRQQIFDQLRESINSGSVPHDERLTEMTVAKLYNVSRTPAREALALLSQAGLLAQDERGYRVPSFSRKDIDDVFEVRHLIEPYAVACIARDATDAELKSLWRVSRMPSSTAAPGTTGTSRPTNASGCDCSRLPRSARARAPFSAASARRARRTVRPSR